MFGREGLIGGAEGSVEGVEGCDDGRPFRLGFREGDVEWFEVGGDGAGVDTIMRGLVEASRHGDGTRVRHHAIHGCLPWRAGVVGRRRSRVFGRLLSLVECALFSRKIFARKLGQSSHQQEEMIHAAIDCVQSPYRSSWRDTCPAFICQPWRK